MKTTQIIQKIYKEILKIKKNDSILILCDKKTKYLAEKFFEAGYIFGKNTLCLEIKEPNHNGEEPDKEVANLMKNFSVILLITSKSLSHTDARKKASQKGSRIASMPNIDEKTIRRCIDIDYQELKKTNQKLKTKLSKANQVKITTKAGTDINFKIYNDKIIARSSIKNKSDFANIPLGEVYVSPIEKTANGIIIIDKSMSGIGKLENQIKIIVKNGEAIKISGKKEAIKLRKLLNSVKNQKAYNIAELGIGTNPKAEITGSPLEDEKVKGTCHIALGNNYSFGGKINVPIHLDGIIGKPTIYLDNKPIIKDGKFES